jgi:hypothetical protein
LMSSELKIALENLKKIRCSTFILHNVKVFHLVENLVDDIRKLAEGFILCHD